jgi:predicted helicase
MLSDIFNHNLCRPDLTPIFTSHLEDSFLQSISDLRPLIYACVNADNIIADPFALHILILADDISPSNLAIQIWGKYLNEIIEKGTTAHQASQTTSLCDEILKIGYELYQSKINPVTRTKSGQWFTPSSVIGYMVRSTVILHERNFGAVSNIPGRILEPSCGVGSFVVALLPYFEGKMQKIDNGTIVACEIDPVAAFLARLNISNKCFELGCKKPFQNILCINMLSESNI